MSVQEIRVNYTRDVDMYTYFPRTTTTPTTTTTATLNVATMMITNTIVPRTDILIYLKQHKNPTHTKLAPRMDHFTW